MSKQINESQLTY